MPTYEYRCKSCDSQFDVWQHMIDDPLTTCPTCGGPVRRVLFPAGIVFKGGGFYSTEQRGNVAPSEGTAAKTGEGSEAKPAASAPSGESKPAAESKTPAVAESKTTTKA